MYIRVLSVLALFVVSAHGWAVPYIQQWQSVGGAKVLFVEAREIPIVDIQIIFDAGSAREQPQQSGLSRLTNSLLDEGADGANANEISQGFDDVGVVYSASSTHDSASVSLRSLVDIAILRPALVNFMRVLTKPDFTDRSLKRQKNRLLVALQDEQQSPGTVAKKALFAAVFGKHPYARPNLGTKESLQRLTRKDVKAFYRKYYVSSNAIVAIVGDVSRARAEKIVAQLLVDLPISKKPEPIPVVTDLTKSEIVIVDYPLSQAHILVGQVGVKRGDKDYFPLYVGNHVLGGSGMVSRLFDDIREKRGLSYSVSSYFYPMRQRGIFISGLQTRADQAREALKVLQNNLSKFIEHGPTEQELEFAKKNITGGFPLKLDSNSKIINYISMIGFYGLPLNYLNTFNASVEAVTVKQIRNAFKRRLLPDKFVTVMLGSELGVIASESGQVSADGGSH